MLNITVAQFSAGGTNGPVAQVFTTSVRNTLICCEVYTIEITGFQDTTSGATAQAQAQAQALAQAVQQMGAPASPTRSLRSRALIELTPTGRLLVATPEPQLMVNYTVSFLYTEFNFTSASHAYSVISGALALGINAGGFEHSFVQARDAAACYGGGGGSCGNLKNARAGQGVVGATLLPFPLPTAQPSEGPPDESNGVPLAVGMAVTMIVFISAFCYFQYFLKPGMLPWWLGGIEAAQREGEESEERDDFEMIVRKQLEEEDVLGQMRSKSTQDLGDPDLRFGFGHAEHRRQTMRAVPLKPDYTAAPPEIANSPAQRARRYSTIALHSNPMAAMFGAVGGSTRGEDAEDSYIASLLGTANIQVMASFSKDDIKTTWGGAIQEQQQQEEEEAAARDALEKQAAACGRTNQQSKTRASSADSSDSSDSDNDTQQQQTHSNSRGKTTASAAYAPYVTQRVPFAGGTVPPVSRGVAASIASTVQNPLQNPLQRNTPNRANAPARGSPAPAESAKILLPPTPPVRRTSVAQSGNGGSSGSDNRRPLASPEASASSKRGVAGVISVRNPLAPAQSPIPHAPAPLMPTPPQRRALRLTAPVPAPALVPLPKPVAVLTPPQRRASAVQQNPAIGFPPAPLYASAPVPPAASPSPTPPPPAPFIPSGPQDKSSGSRSSFSTGSHASL